MIYVYEIDDKNVLGGGLDFSYEEIIDLSKTYYKRKWTLQDFMAYLENELKTKKLVSYSFWE